MSELTLDYFMICTNYAVGEEYHKELFIYSKDINEPIIEVLQSNKEY